MLELHHSFFQHRAAADGLLRHCASIIQMRNLSGRAVSCLPDDRQCRSEVLVHRPWFLIFSPLKRILASGAIAVLIFSTGGALDWFVTSHYLPRISLMLAGALIALVVGTLLFRILTDVHVRYAAMLHRLERIAALNNEIRNGLQIIAYHNAAKEGASVSPELNAAVAQIEAALREISGALRAQQ